MADILVNATNTLLFAHVPNHAIKVTGICYGDRDRADRYFDNRLRSEPWRRSTMDEKDAALAEATRMIDQFNFVGCKASSEQGLQFPRDSDTEVPLLIELACYEIALKLVDGYDPDIEADVLAASGQGFSVVRTTYNRDYIPDHLRAGIPSISAWTNIKCYLRDPNNINIRRV